MRFLRWILISAAAVAVFGCGGGGGTGGNGARNAEVAGVVIDLDGNAVRGARVWINEFGETDSNSSGAYLLDGISDGDWRVRATVTQNGTTYEAETVVRVFEGERTKNINLVVIPESEQARVHGQVVDNQGFVVENAHVFAIPVYEPGVQETGVLSSVMELTNGNGQFSMDKLAGNIEYKITASGVGFNSDVEVVIVDPGESEEVLLALKNPTNPLLPAPTNLSAVSWTSPSEVTRSPQLMSAAENIKRLFDPRTPKQRVTRETINGNWIEIDLFWDQYPDNDSHIGFGVYRRFGNSGDFFALDFLRDPEAEIYEDADADLQEFETWSYIITALNTRYPDTSNSESDDSNIAAVETLGDLFLNPVVQGPVRFRWQTGSGAEDFIVYLFDEYPSIDVGAIWDNSGAPVGGTELTYGGPALQSGHRYYFVVLGLANSDFSRTISEVGTFVAN